MILNWSALNLYKGKGHKRILAKIGGLLRCHTNCSSRNHTWLYQFLHFGRLQTNDLLSCVGLMARPDESASVPDACSQTGGANNSVWMYFTLWHTYSRTKPSQHFKNRNRGRRAHNALDKVEFTSTAIGRKSVSSVQINMCTRCSPAFVRNANVSSSWSSPWNKFDERSKVSNSHDYT